MEKQVYDGSQVTHSTLQEASKLFSEHYGVWGEHATEVIGKFCEGRKERLRAEYLPDNTACSYVRVIIDDRLAGNVFACRWKYRKTKTVCWVTQLVVHHDYRKRGLAISLLNLLRYRDDDVYGIMSSHPAACLVAVKAFGNSLNTIRLDFIVEQAGEIMKVSPMPYIKDAKLSGSLFSPKDASGLVSSADTGFWVDHNEPLEALAWARNIGEWPLGELHDGHEFLLVIERHRTPGLG